MKVVLGRKDNIIYLEDIDYSLIVYKVVYLKNGKVLMVSILSNSPNGWNWTNIIGKADKYHSIGKRYWRKHHDCLRETVGYSGVEVHCFKNYFDASLFLKNILNEKTIEDNTNEQHGF